MSKPTDKEILILQVINDGAQRLEEHRDDNEEMINDYRKNGFGEMHPGNIEDYKTGLHYTHGYTIGHLSLLEKINKLMEMTPEEIQELIEENKRISLKNDEYMKNMLNDIKNKYNGNS